MMFLSMQLGPETKTSEFTILELWTTQFILVTDFFFLQVMPSVISEGSHVHKKQENLAPASYPHGYNLLSGSRLSLGGERCV